MGVARMLLYSWARCVLSKAGLEAFCGPLTTVLAGIKQLSRPGRFSYFHRRPPSYDPGRLSKQGVLQAHHAGASDSGGSAKKDMGGLLQGFVWF